MAGRGYRPLGQVIDVADQRLAHLKLDLGVRVERNITRVALVDPPL
jgi:hypothetical protein